MRKNKSKKRGSVGTFFFGGFIGFLSCVLLIAGTLGFIYYKVSPAWINKTFKTDIDLGTEEANKMTLSDFVTNAVGLVQNYDNYKLSSLEKDFGIKLSDELMGIDISDLKNVELSKLGEAVETKFANISAGELQNIPGMKFDDQISDILDKTNTYYYNNHKLYTTYENSQYSNEVSFDYEISSDEKSVTIKDKTYTFVLNEIEVALWDLPLKNAVGDFVENMGENFTLEDLENNFGVTLPSFLDNVDKKNTTINTLEDAINKLYVADFLGYTIDNSDPDNIIVKDDKQQEITGVMYELAIETVENLKDIESKFGDLTGADLEGTMDLSSLNNILNKTNTYYIDNQTLYSDSICQTEVTFEYEILSKHIKVDGKSFAINTENGTVEVTLKHLPLATAISSYTNNLGSRLTLEELKDEYGVNLPSYIYNGNESATIDQIETIINNLYVADVLGYTIDNSDLNNIIVWNGSNKVTGIMAIIAQKKVNGLGDVQSTIQNQTIATLLDYVVTVDNTDPDNPITTVTDNKGNPVTGLLEKIAPFKITNVDDAINSLTLSDVFDSATLTSGVFKLLDPATVGSLKVTNIANDLKDAIDESSLGELQDAGLIDPSYDLNIMIDTDLDGTKDTLMSGMSLNKFVDVAIFILSK